MGYLLIAVMFYTLVKYGFEAWSQLFYARQANERDCTFGYDILKLEREVDELTNRVKALEGNDPVCDKPHTPL